MYSYSNAILWNGGIRTRYRVHYNIKLHSSGTEPSTSFGPDQVGSRVDETNLRFLIT